MIAPGFPAGAKFSARQSTAILPRADSEQPAEIDDGRVDLTVAANNDIHDASHVLIDAAAHALAKDRGDLLIVEYYCRVPGEGL
jgi:hypothetical protein